MNRSIDVTAVQTAIFDVDGTLIDSNGAHVDAWVQAFRESRVETDATAVRPLIGMGGDKLIPRISGHNEDSALGHAVAGRKKHLFNERLPTLQATAGARDLVKYLRDRSVRLVIATSANDQEMHALLTQAGVADLFPARSSKDDAEASKPDPDIVRAALAKVGGDASTALMIGDTPYDVDAARGAGVATVALLCGGYWHPGDFKDAVLVCKDPADLQRHWQSASR